MRYLLDMKWTGILVAVLCIILGACLLIFPSISINVICWLLGILALIAGVYRVVHYFRDKDFPVLSQSELALGIIQIVGGLVLIFNPSGIVSLLPVILGGYIVVESVFSFQTAFEAIAARTKYSWALMLLAVVPLVLGLVLIFFSSGVASFVTRLAGLAILVWGIAQLWMTTSAANMLKHFAINLHDDDVDGSVE